MRIVHQLLLSAAALLLLAPLPSCGGDETFEACVRYEQYFAQLPCAVDPQTGARLDDGIDCQAFAGYPCPAPGYFTCLTSGDGVSTGTTCDGDQFVSSIDTCVLRCD